MNAAAAGKLALCICTGAVIGAGVNEARHDKPALTKAAAKSPKGGGRKVVQFPCEPYIVQDQMLRDAEIPTDFELANQPQFAALTVPGAGGSVGGGGNDGNGDGGNGGNGPGGSDGGDDDGGDGGNDVPEPAMLALFGLGVAGFVGGRKLLLAPKR